MKILRAVDEFRLGVQFVASTLFLLGMILAIPVLLLGGVLNLMLYQVPSPLMGASAISGLIAITIYVFVRIGRWRLLDTSDQEA